MDRSVAALFGLGTAGQWLQQSSNIGLAMQNNFLGNVFFMFADRSNQYDERSCDRDHQQPVGLRAGIDLDQGRAEMQQRDMQEVDRKSVASNDPDEARDRAAEDCASIQQ